MSHIFYKFKSAKDYDGYRFEGAGVPVWELKKEIIAAKRLGKSNDFDLILTNAQSNEDYVDEMSVIPKNAQVVVRRVPLAAGKKPLMGFGGRAPSNAAFAHRPFVSQHASAGAPAAGPVGEEEKRIRAMMQATSTHWEQNQQDMPLQQMGPRRLFRPANFRGPSATPPENYVCYRCGQKGKSTRKIGPGHFIQNCPTNNDPNFDRAKIRRTTGIPKSFLKPVSAGPDAAGATGNYLVTPEGDLVVAAPNEREWDRLSTIKSLAETISSIPPDSIPDDLKCTLCKSLLNYAVKVSCCQASFCDECLRRSFEESAVSALGAPSIKCPNCQSSITQELIVPDLEKRAQVSDFIERHNKFVLPENDGDAVVQDDDTPDTVPRGNQAGATAKPKAPLPPPPPFMPPFPFMMPGFMPPRPGMPPMFPFFPPPPPLAAAARASGEPASEKRGAHRTYTRSRSRSNSRSRSRSNSRSRSRSDSRSRKSDSRSRSRPSPRRSRSRSQSQSRSRSRSPS